MLAAQIDPTLAATNLLRLQNEGALAAYGFYEAIDYTPEALPKIRKGVIVRAFMAHHQGMGLVALDNVLNGAAMEIVFMLTRWFGLLNYCCRNGYRSAFRQCGPPARDRAVLIGKVSQSAVGQLTRFYQTADLATPRVQLLSNGNYKRHGDDCGLGLFDVRPTKP